MTVDELKLLSLLLIFASGIIGGTLPLRFGKSERSDQLLSLGNAFSGGVFLGAGLIHMMGDAQVGFASLGSDYPIVPLIVGMGFLAILFLEMVALQGSEDVGAMAGDGKGAYPFLLTVVLSLHSLIAGTALGLESSIGASFAILVAIVAHKASAAFALGVSLESARFARRKLLSIITLFSCMTPLGVVLGLAFSRVLEGETAVMVEAIFDALAGGTFIYVAVLDIINESFAEKVDLSMKFTLLLIGFTGMALLALWT